MTRQEQRVIIFLLFSLFAGLGVKIMRERVDPARKNVKWEAQKAALLEDFEKRSQEPERTETAAGESEKTREKAKKAKQRITQKIDLNKASFEELQYLPKIGPAMANRIIEYRKQNGPFKRIEEIQNIKGIGPKTFELIRDFITVE